MYIVESWTVCCLEADQAVDPAARGACADGHSEAHSVAPSPVPQTLACDPLDAGL